MNKQELVVFEGLIYGVNCEIANYINAGWRVVKFETKTYKNSIGSNEVVVTVLFER